MKKLSKTQQACLDKMEMGKRHCAYDLKVSLATLESLVKIGVLDSHVGGLGSLFSPRTARYFWKVELEDENDN